MTAVSHAALPITPAGNMGTGRHPWAIRTPGRVSDTARRRPREGTKAVTASVAAPVTLWPSVTVPVAAGGPA
jgi:hypothetical protein